MKNNSLPVIVAVLLTWFGTQAAQSADAVPSQSAVPVSVAMTLGEIERA